jgi:hypothetical protein
MYHYVVFVFEENLILQLIVNVQLVRQHYLQSMIPQMNAHHWFEFHFVHTVVVADFLEKKFSDHIQ